jgi:hypothetical protein
MYGRGAFEHRQWAEAFSYLSAAQREEQLEAEDLERLAVAAYMVDSGSGPSGTGRVSAFVGPVSARYCGTIDWRRD